MYNTIQELKLTKPSTENGGWPKYQLTAACSSCGTSYADTVSGTIADIDAMLKEGRWICPKCEAQQAT